MGYIVVGVDGTEGSVAALRWAARQAVRLDADLVAVHAWPSSRGPAAVAERDLRGARSAVRDNMLSWVSSALDPQTTPVRVRVEVRFGRPAAVLPAVARSALALVLGDNNAQGSPEAAWLRARCQATALCPVVVVRSVDGQVVAGPTVIGAQQ